MILRYCNFLILLMISIKSSSHEKVNDWSLQQENIRLKADNQRLQESEYRCQQQIKSLNTKLDLLLMDRCTRPSKYADQIQARSIPQLPSSCAAALQNGGQSGIYKLNIPDSGLKPFDVYCLRDPNRGPAWSIVQRRQDGSVDFYRGWSEYKKGFGNFSGEYFIGLEKMHAMTTKVQLQELWIQLEDYDVQKRHAKYEFFAIGNEDTKYALKMLGEYEGNAGNALNKGHKGQKFTTKDHDNDEKELENCAELFTGAWWYSDCYFSNLNGAYGKAVDDLKGIYWNGWPLITSIKYVHMAIRPVN